MKKFLLILFLGLSSLQFLVAKPVKFTTTVDGRQREYLLYKPQNLKKDAGLLVCLHDLNKSMNDFFEGDYDIRAIADKLNMFVLAPQALAEQKDSVNLGIKWFKDNGIDMLPELKAVWGCGLHVDLQMWEKDFFGKMTRYPIHFEMNKPVNDSKFIKTAIVEVLTKNQGVINEKIVFSLGLSVGGFMCYQYALEERNIRVGNKDIAPLAGLISIGGSMGTKIRNSNAVVKLPICDFHTDSKNKTFLLRYNGKYSADYVLMGADITLAQDKKKVIDFWVAKNGANKTAKEEKTFNSDPRQKDPKKGTTIRKYFYENPDGKNHVTHYKLSGSGSLEYSFKPKKKTKAVGIRQAAQDLNIGQVIANNLGTFVKEVKKSNGITSSVETLKVKEFSFYPNPAKDQIYLTVERGVVDIYNINGVKVLSTTLNSSVLDISDLEEGVYIIQLHDGNQLYRSKLVVL